MKKSVGSFLGNKKGQQLPTNAIILIILGVVVLALLIIGFTFGWNTLLPWLNQDNVETIVQQCNAACVTGSKYDFCSYERTLNDGENEIKTTCAIFAAIRNYDKYGIEPCSAITCDVVSCEEVMGGEGELIEGTECPEDYYDVTSIATVETGQICCVKQPA